MVWDKGPFQPLETKGWIGVTLSDVLKSPTMDNLLCHAHIADTFHLESCDIIWRA